MLCNLHTHSTFCDGKSTLEEVVLSAIKKGFNIIGFSGHSYGSHCSYGMQRTEDYISEIKRLKEKYKNDIEVYVGVEEDMFDFCDRSKFEYIIGSCHYFKSGDSYYPIDLSSEEFEIALKECNESMYWLELLFETNSISDTDFDVLTKACVDIRRMLVSSVTTLKQKELK